MERIKSSAELKKRQAVLLAKQQVITEMLEQAYEALLKKEGEEYFALIGKMLDKYVLPKTGEIYFSEKDLDRMPQGFEACKRAEEHRRRFYPCLWGNRGKLFIPGAACGQEG